MLLIFLRDGKNVATSQLKDETFLYALPSGWGLGFNSRKGNMLINEYVPSGQTVENYEEIITTQVLFGGGETTVESIQANISNLFVSNLFKSSSLPPSHTVLKLSLHLAEYYLCHVTLGAALSFETLSMGELTSFSASARLRIHRL